jgi:acyl-CoA synthetase (AMP-forming)/AMP-acid ligase II
VTSTVPRRPFADFAPDFRVADLVRRNATQHGERTAITADVTTLSYDELDSRTNRVAQALREMEGTLHARIAVLDKNSPTVVEVLIGSAKAGLVTVPLNWRLSPAELLAVLLDCQATVLIASDEFGAHLAAVTTELPELQIVAVPSSGTSSAPGIGIDYEGWIAAHEPIDPGHRGDADDPVLLLYTSGTTGTPKGVVGTNRNLAATSSVADQWGVDGSTVMLVAMPLFHIGGLSLVFITLQHGGQMLMIREVKPVQLLDTMVASRVTNAFLVPSVIASLVDVHDAANRDWSMLRSITYGASPITPALLLRALKTFKRPLFQVYGMTETHGAITQLTADDHDPGGPREYLMRSAGRPYPWVELRTVDLNSGAPTPVGVAGELWVRSAGCTPGYFNKPIETSSAIDSDGWLHTGDVAFIDADGYLTISDRLKDMIISGGENVYPVEVEAVLAGHPAVAAVAVIGLPDERWGEAVHAAVQLRSDRHVEADELRQYARQHLAGYKCPKSIEFVARLPLSPTGKVLKREIRARSTKGPQ